MPDLARSMFAFGQRDLVDEDGRPVAEVASPRYDAARTEVVACPYADRRYGMPMNRSALRQMSSVWHELLAASAIAAGPSPTVHAAWAAVARGLALPLASPAPTPRGVAAWFKASLGLSQVYGTLLLGDEGVADTPLAALGTSANFFAVLDAERWLIGAVQACAGTESMIRAVFDATVGGQPPDVAPRWLDRLPMVVDAPTWVGVHAAVLLRRARAARHGIGDAPTHDVPPWLRSLFAVPNRDPAHARRLFPTGRTPAAVQAVLQARDDAAIRDAVTDAVGSDAATTLLR